MQLTGCSFKVCRKRYVLLAVAICAIFLFTQFVNIRDLFPPTSQTLTPKVRASLTASTANTGHTAAAAEATTDYHRPQAMVKTAQREAVYVQRRQESQAWCGKGGQGGNVAKWTRYNNTAYCVLPKVGCTFWKNVFRYLHGDTGGSSYPSPFHIPKVFTHTGPMKRMRLYGTQDQGYLKDDFRFLFVRDPYSRLYSAFVDKLLLPDFWRVLGVPIAKRRANRSNVRCGSDISFQEFLDFVVSQRPTRFSNHWRPTHTLCNPCVFQPHVIGKMETFAQDARYILQFMNSTWMWEHYSHHRHVLQEVEMITQYNFAIWRKRKHVRHCVSQLQLCLLLWKAFQINGYLPSDKPFPMHVMPEKSEEQFVSVVQRMHEEETAKNGSSQWRQQKVDMMVKAYRDIRPDTLEKLKEMYKYDFLMFHYEQQPENIFQHRKGLDSI